jgi:hypothetical protein
MTPGPHENPHTKKLRTGSIQVQIPVPPKFKPTALPLARLCREKYPLMFYLLSFF